MRILSVVAAAALALGLAATSAAAWAPVGEWRTATSDGADPDCGHVSWGHDTDSAFIDSAGCDWIVALRVKYNELGTNYTSSWASGEYGVAINRPRISQYQIGY